MLVRTALILGLFILLVIVTIKWIQISVNLTMATDALIYYQNVATSSRSEKSPEVIANNLYYIEIYYKGNINSNSPIGVIIKTSRDGFISACIYRLRAITGKDFGFGISPWIEKYSSAVVKESHFRYRKKTALEEKKGD